MGELSTTFKDEEIRGGKGRRWRQEESFKSSGTRPGRMLSWRVLCWFRQRTHLLLKYQWHKWRISLLCSGVGPCTTFSLLLSNWWVLHHFLAIMNSTSIKTRVQLSLSRWVLSSLDLYSEVWLLDYQIILFLCFMRNPHTVFKMAVLIYTPINGV